MDIALFDYGTGNLHSLGKALEQNGARVRIEPEVPAALRADALVLPGVGAFSAAATRLAPYTSELRAALDDGFPCLGVCLGMQLLFEASEEGGGPGVGALPGRIRRIRAKRIPQMGWNAVETTDDPLFTETSGLLVYYANSFVAQCDDAGNEIAWSQYSADRFPAAVRHARTWGVQFHPEKSGAAGLSVIRNFIAQAES